MITSFFSAPVFFHVRPKLSKDITFHCLRDCLPLPWSMCTIKNLFPKRFFNFQSLVVLTWLPFCDSGWRIEEVPLVKECSGQGVRGNALLASIYWRSYRAGIWMTLIISFNKCPNNICHHLLLLLVSVEIHSKPISLFGIHGGCYLLHLSGHKLYKQLKFVDLVINSWYNFIDKKRWNNNTSCPSTLSTIFNIN